MWNYNLSRQHADAISCNDDLLILYMHVHRGKLGPQWVLFFHCLQWSTQSVCHHNRSQLTINYNANDAADISRSERWAIPLASASLTTSVHRCFECLDCWSLAPSASAQLRSHRVYYFTPLRSLEIYCHTPLGVCSWAIEYNIFNILYTVWSCSWTMWARCHVLGIVCLDIGQCWGHWFWTDIGIGAQSTGAVLQRNAISIMLPHTLWCRPRCCLTPVTSDRNVAAPAVGTHPSIIGRSMGRRCKTHVVLACRHNAPQSVGTVKIHTCAKCCMCHLRCDVCIYGGKQQCRVHTTQL